MIGSLPYLFTMMMMMMLIISRSSSPLTLGKSNVRLERVRLEEDGGERGGKIRRRLYFWNFSKRRLWS